MNLHKSRWSLRQTGVCKLSSRHKYSCGLFVRTLEDGKNWKRNCEILRSTRHSRRHRRRLCLLPMHHYPLYYISSYSSQHKLDNRKMHSSTQKLTSSIAIIGAGDVGASIAYSLLLNPVAHDVILVDLKEELLEAQVRDLGDATFRGNAGVRVKKGTFEEAGQADVIVITAGAKQKKGKSDLTS
jgi:FlaA1/EpsC-like NDP-sugar epimerase